MPVAGSGGEVSSVACGGLPGGVCKVVSRIRIPLMF